MKGKRPTYTAEYKDEVLRVLRTTGQSQVEVARAFGIPDRTLRRWQKLPPPESRARTALTAHERAELKRLRKEVAVLREEQEILRKASAFFAKGTR